MILRKILILIFIMMSSFLYVRAFENEDLHYVISYKWGLIHKDAGDATLSLKNKGNTYEMVLTGKTKPWADKFYKVRDTLIANVKKDGFIPLSYSKIAHEKGKYSRDDIKYELKGDSVIGNAIRTKQNDKGKLEKKNKRFAATGDVFDMLTVFYYLRNIDYNNLQKGDRQTAKIFSGTGVETLTLRYDGRETIKLSNGEKREAFHILFKFTTAKKKKSSEDMNAWISTDPSHIPLLVTGSLPVGEVRCSFVP